MARTKMTHLHAFPHPVVYRSRMRAKTILLSTMALCASLAMGQDRIFTFAHTETAQQMMEIGTAIQHTLDINDLSVNVAQKQVSVHTTPDLMALVGWLFDELDRPLTQQTPPTQNGAVLKYEMPGAGADNVVRIFYLPYTRTLQDFQEVATLVRSTALIRR